VGAQGEKKAGAGNPSPGGIVQANCRLGWLVLILIARELVLAFLGFRFPGSLFFSRRFRTLGGFRHLILLTTNNFYVVNVVIS
jgi:hypothetical protein